MKDKYFIYSSKYILLFLFGILLIKLASHGFYPIIDTSEARYAEMVRKMVETNEWVMPMYDYDIPFWGKPPLAIWTQAIAAKIIGINEFALRLPSWLFHIGSCILIFLLGKNYSNKCIGILAVLIFSSSFLGLITSGAIITDPALCFFTLLVFYCFWKFTSENINKYAYVGFISLGLGILVKGFLILILFGLPIILWITINHEWAVFRKIPWKRGIYLMLLFSLPWFLLAEWQSPGFLEYFIVGEHWQRFVVKDWEGDLYGDAHEEAIGTIWIYLIIALLPWSIFLPKAYSTIAKKTDRNTKKWHNYLLCWGLCTPIFFTFSQNILWTYVLPAMPAWSLLLSEGVLNIKKSKFKYILYLALIIPVTYLITIIEGSYFEKVKNQKDIIIEWEKLSVNNKHNLYYLRRYYSAEFYSDGNVEVLSNENGLLRQKSFYIAIRERDYQRYYSKNFETCITESIINKTRILHCIKQEE